MTFEEYQKAAVSFRTDTANNEEYLTLGLIAEVGEAADKLAKRYRDGVFDEKAFIKELGDILWFVANLAEYYDKRKNTDYCSYQLSSCFETTCNSDCPKARIMQYLFCDIANIFDGIGGFYSAISWIVSLAKRYGYTLEQVAEINIAKLRDRQARGVIKGNGDER